MLTYLAYISKQFSQLIAVQCCSCSGGPSSVEVIWSLIMSSLVYIQYSQGADHFVKHPVTLEWSRISHDDMYLYKYIQYIVPRHIMYYFRPFPDVSIYWHVTLAFLQGTLWHFLLMDDGYSPCVQKKGKDPRVAMNCLPPLLRCVHGN